MSTWHWIDSLLGFPVVTLLFIPGQPDCSYGIERFANFPGIVRAPLSGSCTDNDCAYPLDAGTVMLVAVACVSGMCDPLLVAVLFPRVVQSPPGLNDVADVRKTGLQAPVMETYRVSHARHTLTFDFAVDCVACTSSRRSPEYASRGVASRTLHVR